MVSNRARDLASAQVTRGPATESVSAHSRACGVAPYNVRA